MQGRFHWNAFIAWAISQMTIETHRQPLTRTFTPTKGLDSSINLIACLLGEARGNHTGTGRTVHYCNTTHTHNSVHVLCVCTLPTLLLTFFQWALSRSADFWISSLVALASGGWDNGKERWEQCSASTSSVEHLQILCLLCSCTNYGTLAADMESSRCTWRVVLCLCGSFASLYSCFLFLFVVL